MLGFCFYKFYAKIKNRILTEEVLVMLLFSRSPFGDLFGIIFTIVPLLVLVTFVFIFGSIISNTVQNAKQRKKTTVRQY